MKWGIVTNGLQIRLLRDFFHTHTRGYVEFDVESILYERNFTDFRTLYRLIHTSRFIRDEENKSVLDRFYEKSVAAGSKIGEGLRENVKKAIELIGNGLLNHEKREEMILDQKTTKEFYQEILSIIYRILFLMFAEQRGMLPMHNSLYVEEYSITKLRERSETRISSDNHFDLWHGLFATFSLIRDGSEELDVFGYNGDLFDDSNLIHIIRLSCKNDHLLRAIKYLTLYEKGKVLQRINFLDLGVEEIGSIYESLLDFTPRVLENNEEINNKTYTKGEFILDPRGAGRKTSGSYYTDRRLIGKIIESSLKPIVERTIAQSGNTVSEKEKSILQLKVCDPACGSGAFLIAANNYIGKELAKIRASSEYPSEREIRVARRDVLRCCIYGVDLNPMAIELAKVSLWINASVKNLPLNFLDHHLKCGNSLVGTDIRRIRKGISDTAFQPIEGENRDITRKYLEINRQQKKHKFTLDKYVEIPKLRIEVESFQKLDELVEISTNQIKEKRIRYYELINDDSYLKQKLSLDFWTSVFFWKFKEAVPNVPTESNLRLVSEGNLDQVNYQLIEEVNRIAEKYSFFHWELEFPEVFIVAKGGFDCIFGNPPWEKLNFEEKQFFASLKPEISQASNATKRKQLISKLRTEQTELYEAYIETKNWILKYNKFLRNSNIYPLTGKGQINLFSVFTELAMKLINEDGYSGLIVPSNLISDFTYKEFFQELMKNDQIVLLLDFVNSKGIFPDLHRMYKFCLFIARKKPEKENGKTEFAFFLEDLGEISAEKTIELDMQDIALINPNTLTCPIFSSRRDFEIIKKIHQANPIIFDSRNPVFNGIRIHRMFNMADDSNLFKSKNDLEKHTKKEESQIFFQENSKLLPIYESKLIWLYDHRFASFENCTIEDIRKGHAKRVDENKKVLYYNIEPRYWIDEFYFANKKKNWEWSSDWFLSVRSITNARNSRTCITTIIPNYPTVHTINHILGLSAIESLFLCSIMNSMVFDYCTRIKVGGTHFAQFIIEQLPIIPFKKWLNYIDIVKDKCIELIYTSYELESFADDCGYTGKPFKWNEERRMQIKCEIDAIYALLYGLEKEELEYIIETFPIIKKTEIEQNGEYRTKRLILENYDKYDKIIKEI